MSRPDGGTTTFTGQFETPTAIVDLVGKRSIPGWSDQTRISEDEAKWALKKVPGTAQIVESQLARDGLRPKCHPALLTLALGLIVPALLMRTTIASIAR